MIDLYHGDDMRLIKKNNNKINKSKEIIKKEKANIKEEKRRIKLENSPKIHQSKLEKNNTIKTKILSIILFEIMGALTCLIILFILSGGKNFIKLYGELSKVINVYGSEMKQNYEGVGNKWNN